MKNLTLFLSGKEKNAWVYSRDYKIYVRKSMRLINGQMVPVFDLSSIQSFRPGRGGFDQFFQDLCKAVKPKYSHIYIESVINERFAAHLRNLGLQEISIGGVANFVKSF